MYQDVSEIAIGLFLEKGFDAVSQAPVVALREHVLRALGRRDPVTGLNDEPGVLDFHRLLYGTPSLVARLYAYLERSEAVSNGAAIGSVKPRKADSGSGVTIWTPSPSA